MARAIITIRLSPLVISPRETGERASLIIICRTLGLAWLAKLISQIFEGSHERRINIAQVARFVRILMNRAAPSGHHAYKLVSVL